MARKKSRLVFEPTARGFVVNLEREERDLVTRLVGELRELLLTNDPMAEPLLRRLFPPAYHRQGDAEADAEYQRLMREELVASRLTAIDEASRLLHSDAPLDDAAMQGLLQSLNAVRLVLGTMLDVGEKHDPGDVSEDDPMIGEHHLYQFLSFLLESAVQALSGEQE